MRLDKYLKITRLIKRRTVAKVLIDEGNILINGKVAKPSSIIKVGDKLDLKLGNRNIKLEVFSVSEIMNKSESKSMFKILNDNLTTIK